MSKKQVLCIVGPTASGKTALSIELAKHVSTEIIYADSMQVYKGMNIGTAKPTAEERAGIVHHMLDEVEPFEEFSVAEFVQKAKICVDEVLAKGKLPIIVGGTGFYIEALVSGTWFEEKSERSSALRESLNQTAQTEAGMEQLMSFLKSIDPEAAGKISKNDRKRVIRAIEVFRLTGRTITEHNRMTAMTEKQYTAKWIGLTTSSRDILYNKINQRVDDMLKGGLLDEVRELIEKKKLSQTAAQAIGYKELAAFLEGQFALEEAVDLIKKRSRNYAKRQLTWFRRNSDIFWNNLDSSKDFFEILQNSIEFVSTSV